MEKALLKAIEGGLKEGEKWKLLRANQYWALWLDGNGTETNIAVEKYLLDPEFWRALGKAEGWTVQIINHGNWDDMETMTTEEQPRWKYEWHRFVDHVSDGNSPDSFFEQLLTDKK